MNIYIINGAPRTGKDSFYNYVAKLISPYANMISSVDLIKEIATKCGWDGEKTPESRKYLSDLKKLLTEWLDAPVKDMANKIRVLKNEYEECEVESKLTIFLVIREPNEIERCKKEFGAKTILIRREDSEKCEASNDSDANVLDYEYDIVIDNNGDLRDLANKAIHFVLTEGLPIKSEEFVLDLFGNLSYN